MTNGGLGDCVLVAASKANASFPVPVISAYATCRLMEAEPDAISWLLMVREVGTPAVTADTALESDYATLCDEFQDIFEEPGMPPHHDLEHNIDLN